MELKNKALWEKSLANNTDPYGAAGHRYAEAWANLMEAELAEGKTVAEIAGRTSHEADAEGITGFMHGCAVGILSAVWRHGEALRRWHNKDTQIGDEGDKANESGGILNPAVMCIGGGK